MRDAAPYDRHDGHDAARRDALGGAAMIAGALMALVTMALHPTARDVAADVRGQGALALAVHAVAIAAVPVALYGAVALTRRLTAAGGLLAELALAFQAMAAVASLVAATASGLLAPALFAQLADASGAQGAERAVAAAVLHYNGDVNRAFARVLVAASSVAIGLWSVEIVRTRALRRGAGALGIVVAAATLLALVAGRLRLDVHGFGAVVLGQGIWLVMVGTELRRARTTTPAA